MGPISSWGDQHCRLLLQQRKSFLRWYHSYWNQVYGNQGWQPLHLRKEGCHWCCLCQDQPSRPHRILRRKHSTRTRHHHRREARWLLDRELLLICWSFRPGLSLITNKYSPNLIFWSLHFFCFRGSSNWGGRTEGENGKVCFLKSVESAVLLNRFLCFRVKITELSPVKVLHCDKKSRFLWRCDFFPLQPRVRLWFWEKEVHEKQSKFLKGKVYCSIKFCFPKSFVLKTSPKTTWTKMLSIVFQTLKLRFQTQKIDRLVKLHNSFEKLFRFKRRREKHEKKEKTKRDLVSQIKKIGF